MATDEGTDGPEALREKADLVARWLDAHAASRAAILARFTPEELFAELRRRKLGHFEMFTGRNTEEDIPCE